VLIISKSIYLILNFSINRQGKRNPDDPKRKKKGGKRWIDGDADDESEFEEGECKIKSLKVQHE